MKKFITLIVLAGLMVLGCQENHEIVSPVSLNNDENLSKTNLIPIPSMEGLNIKHEVSAQKLVSGSEGTLIQINTLYKGGLFGYVQVSASLQFLPNSFEGERIISMALDENDAFAEFGPKGSFDKPAILNLVYTGLDLREFDPKNIDFVYLDEYGKVTPVEYESLFVDIQSGTMRVTNAKLPHFSRYGFVK